MDLRASVWLTLDEKAIVDEPLPGHCASFWVALGRHLVRDAIETGNLGEREEASKESFLTGEQQDRGQYPEETMQPALTARPRGTGRAARHFFDSIVR